MEQPQAGTADALWKKADGLAREGNFLEAVRVLHLGVLALLHRAHLIRYESTRTNGEYARQLQERDGRSPTVLQDAFRRLTFLFETKWYGERACRPDDYRSCRDLAESIRGYRPKPEVS